MLVLREICREDYLSGKKPFFFLMLEKRLTMDNMCETRKFILDCIHARSCLTLSHAMDCSSPGSSIHGIFQARVLEWGAICLLLFSPKSCLYSVCPLIPGWQRAPLTQCQAQSKHIHWSPNTF